MLTAYSVLLGGNYYIHMKQVGQFWMHLHAFYDYYSTNPYFHSEADQMDILNIYCKNDREMGLVFKNEMKRIYAYYLEYAIFKFYMLCSDKIISFIEILTERKNFDCFGLYIPWSGSCEHKMRWTFKVFLALAGNHVFNWRMFCIT